MSILSDFTRAIASGIALARIEVRRVLPGLYLTNTTDKPDLKLVYTGDYPNIYPQAYNEYLDLLGSMFNKPRFPQEADENYRQRILFSLTESVTKTGIKNTLKFLFKINGLAANITVIESYNNAFDGISTTFNTPLRNHSGTLLYGIMVIITPENLKSTTRFVPISPLIPDSYYVLDAQGEKTYSSDGERVLVWLLDINNVPTVFNRYSSINEEAYLTAFNVPTFKYIIEDLVAVGVKISKIIIRAPGTGGNKGEVYANQA